MGKDRVSFMLLPQLPDMLQQVLAKYQNPQSRDLQDSLRLTEWMNFVCQTYVPTSLTGYTWLTITEPSECLA
jgi:hypothetical protein